MGKRLQALCPIPLEVVWHENRSTYLSVRKGRGKLHLRVHKLFYDAPTPVLEALVRYAMRREDGKARAVIRQMAHLYFSGIEREAEPLCSAGEVYDLQEIFDRLTPLVPVTGVTIGWSKRSRVGRFRSMTFGTYDKQRRQIRIHPWLDDLAVPRYFVAFIVYHEMLHAIYPSKMDGMGRCSVHTAEFREKEKLFPEFEAAKQWAKGSLLFFKKRGRSHGRA